MTRKAANRLARADLLWIMASIVLPLIAVGYFVLGIGQPHHSWHAAGPIQALGGPEEAWIFVQRDIIVQSPGWGERRSLNVGYNQEVIIISAKGVKRRISVPDGKEVTVHKNSSRVFRHNNEIHLLRDESVPWPVALFKWETDHFQLMSPLSHQEFLKEQGLDKNNTEVFEQTIDSLTVKNDWKHLCEDSPFNFTWNGQLFEIKEERQRGVTKLVLRSLGSENRWEEVLIQFDPTPRKITRGEYQKLWHREDPAYPKSAYLK